jgi:hypothetical protein
MLNKNRREEVAQVVQTVHKCLYKIFIYVCGFQWIQSRMYASFSGDKRVCMRVSVETITYFRGCTT